MTSSPFDASDKYHHFQETNFSSPTFCDWCQGFIWGLVKQGFQCTYCQFNTHKKCLNSVPTNGCQGKLKQAGKAFAEEIRNDTSFGVFTPTNTNEAVEMTKQIEQKILQDLKSKHSSKGGSKIFNLADVVPVLTDAASVIVEDEFTQCFESAAPRPWNWNIYLYPSWLIGIFIRYCILFPLRVTCLLTGSFIIACLLILSWFIRNKDQRKLFHQRIIQLYCSIFVASWSGVIRYHGPKPKQRANSVFVANHTTVFDIVILQQNFCFSIVGQKHPGVMGFFQQYILNSLNCMWFDRKDSKDRAKLSELIKAHVSNEKNLPLLLFPEGTCVNNDYCVMFKKGAFELGATVYPIAIKYNKLFSDPFYNSREQTFLQHLLRLMTSWAVVCDVWYLEPQTLRPGESVVDFTSRVKSMIVKKAGIQDVPWDGYLKYFKPSAKFVEERRKLYASSLIARYSHHNLIELEAEGLASESKKRVSKIMDDE